MLCFPPMKPEIQCAADDLAGIDGDVVHRATRLLLIGDQDVLAVQVQHAELLDLAMRHRGVAIIQKRLLPAFSSVLFP